MRSVAEVGRRFPLPPYRGWYRSGLGAQASLPRTIQDKGLESSPTLSLLFRVLTASLISSVFFLIASSNDSSPSAERPSSPAAGNRSDAGAEAGGSQLQGVVRHRPTFRPGLMLGKLLRPPAFPTFSPYSCYVEDPEPLPGYLPGVDLTVHNAPRTR